ncbi:MupA/Atu3671 family FMN-dependent luciferase-like monooxygenase [Streptomyces sp. N2A]|uniref:MupA/Atu3671 family FMN-dependent luciferase-like monooxygenase n=1 Tax=Streptomyces sp. N2A TaxID=3073936 RepID=UPI002870A7F0|nr:MupA/Atu3671 family FMN-dependent luciferase-like monooxygenase [Streptomyces sp. N2A]
MRFSLFFFANGDDPDEQYRLLIEASRFADAAGFSAVWTPERHFHPFGAPFPNPAVTGAAVAAATRRIAVRAGSVVLPLHDPLRVAEEWAVVDRLSGGRAEVAFASGWNPQDFVLAPERFTEAKQEMRRGIDEVLQLWSGTAVERTGPGGRRYPVRTYPTPRQGGLPLWITAAGSPGTYALAGELGAGVLTHLLGQSLDELEENLAGYTDALTAHGHGIERERVCVMVHTHLGPDRERALAAAKGPLMAYMRSSLSLFGLGSTAPAGDGTGEDALDELLELAYLDFSRDRCLLGSAADALPLVEALAALGVDEIGCLIDFGIGTDEVLHSLTALAELNRRCADL